MPEFLTGMMYVHVCSGIGLNTNFLRRSMNMLLRKNYNKTKEVVITIQGAMYIYLSVRMNPSSSMNGNLWFGFFFTNSG